MYTINFFGRAGDLYRRTRDQDRKFLTGSWIIFGLTLGVFGLVLSLNLYFGFQLKEAAANQTQTLQSLLDSQPLEVSYLIFSQKLKSIAEIFEHRNNKQQAINYLANLFGDQVFISGVSYDGEAQVLSLNLDSADIFKLENLLSSLDTPEVKTNFSSLTKSNIKRNEDGSYGLKVTLELKQSASGSAMTPPATPTSTDINSDSTEF
ncbi:MAG TPA: hypothetical protein DEP87_03850 [Candidatus Pacebacteria bacterium]|nr:hypothetical protein [Candidatus Paceibacterota bacterium]